MKHALKVLSLSALTLPLVLSGCGSIARTAADNTPVDLLHLSNAELTGQLEATNTSALSGQALQAQGISTGKLTYSGTFDDLDKASIPGIVGDPSGLDIPLQVQSLFLGPCKSTVTPTSDDIKVTINQINLNVRDVNGNWTLIMQPNDVLPMKKTATGSYTPNVDKAQSMATIVYNYVSFIVEKRGANTPNSYTLTLDVSVDSGSSVTAYPCLAKMLLASDLKQYVRFK